MSRLAMVAGAASVRRRRLVLPAGFILAAALVPAEAPAAPAGAGSCHRITLHGEVRDRQTWRRHLGMGLDFRMEPDGDGWDFEIGPRGWDSSQIISGRPARFDMYIYALTPPWRGQLVTDLDITDDTPPEVMAAGFRREFWFLTDITQEKRASADLGSLVFSSPRIPPAQAARDLAKLPRGKGVLEIVSADIVTPSPDPDPYGNEGLGKVQRLGFRVRLTVPPGFVPAPTVRSRRVPCPDFGEWERTSAVLGAWAE